jgi:hypothetical protein
MLFESNKDGNNTYVIYFYGLLIPYVVHIIIADVGNFDVN